MEPLRYDRNKIFKFPEGRVIKWSVYKPPPKNLRLHKIVIYENTPQQAKQQPTFMSNSALISFDEQT